MPIIGVELNHSQGSKKLKNVEHEVSATLSTIVGVYIQLMCSILASLKHVCNALFQYHI